MSIYWSTKDDRLYKLTIYDQEGYEIHKTFLLILNKNQEIGLMGLQKLLFLAIVSVPLYETYQQQLS